jgi:chromosome partitioning protein
MRDTTTAAFYVEKGGVGKTTSSAHIATSAALDHDLDVCLIDLAGTQNDLAAQFGISEDVADPDAPISAVFGDDWDFIVENISNVVERMVYETGEGPDLIPADAGLSGADNNLASVPVEDRYLKLAGFIQDQLADEYDAVFLDLPGKESNIALNGIFAAEHIVTPLSPGEFERNQLSNLDDDLEAIREDLHNVLDKHDVYPHLAMVIPTMISKTTNESEEFVADITEEYPDIAAESVAKTQNISNNQGEGRTLFSVDEDDLYDTGVRAREAYRTNTDLLLDRLSHS